MLRITQFETVWLYRTRIGARLYFDYNRKGHVVRSTTAGKGRRSPLCRREKQAGGFAYDLSKLQAKFNPRKPRPTQK